MTWWEKLRKRVGVGAKAEAEAAHEVATGSVRRAETQREQAKQIAGRMIEIGFQNHIGERIEEAWRRA